MNADPVYLDHNASAPIRPEAREAAICALDIGGNPSSIHAAGRLARAAVEQARSQVAGLIGGDTGRLVFTSGGTEANALAIESAVLAGARLPIVLMTEHDSVMVPATACGHWVEAWPVLQDGIADLAWLEDRLKGWASEDGAPFVCIALANSETGVIQPVAEVAAMVHAAGGWLHVDAVQAAGRIPVDMNALGADTLTLSGHKLGGPIGAGALAFSPRAKVRRRSFGGGQERGLRAGTENVSGIAGFGAAAAAGQRDLPLANKQALWRDAAAERLKAQGCVVAGEGAPRLPGTLCIIADGFASELQVMALDLAGVRVSAGSACSSGKVTPSHVLAAMQMMGVAGFALRASGGWNTTQADWMRFADAWEAAHARHTARRKVA